MLHAPFEEDLHAHADPEDRAASCDAPADEPGAVDRFQLLHDGGEGADARDEQAVRRLDRVRAAGQLNLSADVLEGPHGRADVPRAVVEDRDARAAHRAPFVDGTPVTRGSRSTAERSARAKALNWASTM